MGITMSPNPLILGQDKEPADDHPKSRRGAYTYHCTTLSGYDQSLISLPETVTIPANSSSANVIHFDASDPGQYVDNCQRAEVHQSGSVPVNVVTPTITITFQNNLTSIAVGQTIRRHHYAEFPGPATLRNNDNSFRYTGSATLSMYPAWLRFSSPSVFIPAGSATGTFLLAGAEVRLQSKFCPPRPGIREST